MKQIASTPRLRLREYTPQDAAFIVELVNTEGWQQFIGDRKIYSENDALRYLENGPFSSYTQHGFGPWCMELAETGEVIGTCGLIKRDGLEDVDIGFAILPQYEGKGYVSEAAQKVLQLAEHRFGLKRIVAITSLDNDRSINLLKRLGFVLEKTVFLPGDKEELNLFGLQLHPFSIETTEEPDPETKEVIRALWNNEYPAGLHLTTPEDFELYLGGLETTTHYLLRDNEKRLVGWGITFHREEMIWFAMILDRSIHGKGSGSRLLEHMKKQHSDLYGWVIDHDRDVRADGEHYRSPLSFYLKNGFEAEPAVRLELPVLSAVRIHKID